MNRRSFLRLFGLAATALPLKASASPTILGADISSAGISFSNGALAPFDAAGELSEELIVLLKGQSAGKTELLIDSFCLRSTPNVNLSRSTWLSERTPFAVERLTDETDPYPSKVAP